MCIFVWVSDYSSGFGDPQDSELDFHLKQCSGWIRILTSGFEFGFPDIIYIRCKPAPLPSLFVTASDTLVDKEMVKD